jgi:hypothetical protein
MTALANAAKAWPPGTIILHALAVAAALALLIFVGYSCKNCDARVQRYGTSAPPR